MKEFFNTICIVLITFTTTITQSQECKKILHTTAIRENLDIRLLDCRTDQHHELRIFKAEYRVLRTEDSRLSDDEDLNASCFIKGFTDEIKEKCHKNKQCLFQEEDFEGFANDSAPVYPYGCDSYTGSKYLMITWQCRAMLNQDYNAYAIDLDDKETHELSFAVVDSHPLWRWSLNYCHPLLNRGCHIPEDQVKDMTLITSHDNGCSFVVPPNTELWVLAHEFYKFNQKDDPNYIEGRCEQNIQVYNSEERWQFCTQGDFFKVPCQDQEQTFYFKYKNTTDKMRVGFAIYFEVDYEVPTMKSTCGIPVNELPTPPNVDLSSVRTTTTTTTNAPTRSILPTTALPARPSKSFTIADVPSWIIVLLAVVVGTMIMLAVISIVCCRHCCKKTGYLEDNQSQDAFGVVSEISTSDSSGNENLNEEPKPSKPSLVVDGKFTTTGPKSVHFVKDIDDDDYTVGGDAKYDSLKSEGYDFF